MSTGFTYPLTLEKIRGLVDELRDAYEDLLDGETIAAPAQIRSIVAEWSSEVMPAIEARIARCHELIRRGMPDEAVRSASESPDLFEAVKLLDLDRFGRSKHAAWMEASRAAGLVCPSPPPLDRFSDLEEAQHRVAALRPLLEQWRRLNIQRAPLPTRIRALVALLRRDAPPHDNVWQEMLVDHEKHRIMEIKAELGRLRDRWAKFPKADAADIRKRLGGYLAELQSEWRTLQPPSELEAQAALLEAEVGQRLIDASLDGLVGQLESAHALLATDRPAAKTQISALVDAWNRALTDRGVIDPADPRLARVDPILDYAGRLRTQDTLLAEIAQRQGERPTTLRSRIAWSEDLDRMMDHIDDAASRLPAADVDMHRIGELSDRVAHIAEIVQREVRLRRILQVSAAAVTLLVVAAASWTAYAFQQHQVGVQAAIGQCKATVAAIEAGGDADPKLDAAWPVKVRQDPAVAAALDRVYAAARARDDRKEALAACLDEVRKALAELQAADRADPLTPWPEAFARTVKLLADAKTRRLAVSDQERALLEPLSATLRAKAREFGQAADDAFEDRVRRLEADVMAVELLLANDPARAAMMLDKVATDLDGLRTIASMPACPTGGAEYGLRKLVSGTAAALVGSDSKAVAGINKQRTRRAVLAGIAGREAQADRLLADGKYAAYADAIRDIAKDIGSGPVSRDYAAVADNHAAWQAIADWTRFVSEFPNPAKIRAEEAESALEKLEELSADVMRIADAAAAKKWLEPGLKRATARSAKDLATLQSKVERLLEGRNGEELDGVVVEKDVTDYPRYYCLLKDRPLPDVERPFHYVTGYPDAARHWPTTSKKFDPSEHEVKDSPQKRLVLACKAVLERETAAPADCDAVALALVQACTALAQAEGGDIAIDPCLHAILVRFLLEFAADGSPALTEGFVKSLALINAGTAPNGDKLMIRGVDNRVFEAALDPKQQNAGAWVQAQRAKCAEFLRMVAAEAATTASVIENQRKDFVTRCGGLRQWRCVGRLRKLSEGGWAISGGDPDALAGQQLFTAGGQRDGFQMLPCVTCDGKGMIPPGTDVKARGGEPVYVGHTKDRKG